MQGAVAVEAAVAEVEVEVEAEAAVMEVEVVVAVEILLPQVDHHSPLEACQVGHLPALKRQCATLFRLLSGPLEKSTSPSQCL